MLRPVIAPWALTKVEGSKKSAKPPRMRKGASAFLRGYNDLNDELEMTSARRVNFPTFPHLAGVNTSPGEEKKRPTLV